MWWLVQRYLGFIALVLAACHGDDGPSTDGGPLDSPPGDETVLVLDWQADPAIPGGDDDNLQVATASIGVQNLRVIGDASSGSDTSLASLALAWQGSGDPAPTTFAHAPPALYSRVELDIRGADSLDVTGTVRINGDATPFHVHLDPDASASVETSLDLAARTTGTIHVHVDATQMLDGVDFGHAPNVGGTLDIDDSSADKPHIAENLAESFGSE